MPSLLREMWAHVHPDAPSPLYTIRRTRNPSQEDSFKATVLIHNNATRHNTVAYTFDLETSSRIHQAVRDATLRAIVGLRCPDPELTNHRRYAFFPRAISRWGECLFPICPDEEDPDLVHFGRFATLLSYHMAELQRFMRIPAPHSLNPW